MAIDLRVREAYERYCRNEMTWAEVLEVIELRWNEYHAAKLRERRNHWVASWTSEPGPHREDD